MSRSVGLFTTFQARCLKTKSPTRFIQTWHHSCQMTLCKELSRGSSAERLKPFNHSRGGNYEVQRQFSAGVACYQKPTVHKLSSRGIVRVAGADAGVFLQGLITNDVNLITASKTAMYAMLLNVQGRVMYDLIVYNTASDPGNPVFLVECDSSLTDSLVKDIRKYKLRKKIDISDVTTELHVSAVIPPGNSDSAELSVPESECVMFTPDPRVKQFGWRLVSTADGPMPGEGVLGTEADYHSYRYQWGVSEGCLDLPPGNCFPLESNLVYLHGASFQKGCYIGQELTARTYHTGVTRKRLMPLLLQHPLGEVPAGTDIKTDANKLAGKYRHSVGKYGLGLLRLEHVKSKLVIKTESGQTLDVQTEIPSWWPSDPEG